MVLEGNKDEAEKCFALAAKFFREGSLEKALRFANKSNKLFPSENCAHLIEKIKASDNSQSNGNATGFKDNVRQRKSAPSPCRSGNTSETEVNYTQEQVEACRKIKKCKDYYEILGVSKEATESDLKKAYRKLALQFHPDKNKAPGANEAFKVVGNAFSILSDPKKRKDYDHFGPEHSRDPGVNHCSRFASDDAEELFNMFFGGHYSGGNVYFRRSNRWEQTNMRGFGHGHAGRHQHEGTPSEQSTLSVLFQLMPLLIIIMVSLVSSLVSGDPVYSLSPSSKYAVLRTTHNLGVNYYVKPDFNTEFTGSLRKLEQRVEEDYVDTLRDSCHKERRYKDSMIWRARTTGDGQLYKKAQDLRTPSCDLLHGLYS